MFYQRIFVVALPLLLAACASVPDDWGRADVARVAGEHGRKLPQVKDAATLIAERTQAPLTADSAVQLALLNNPDLRAQAAQLGIAAADVYEAGRLANPVLSATRLSPGDNNQPHPQLTLGVAFNFVNLLFLPANSRYAKAGFESAKLGASAAALELAAHTEAAWFEAAGADRIALMREQASTAAQASATLAQRYFDAGNISQKQLAMEQASATRARLDAISARAAAVDAHGALNRLMGLSATQDGWQLDGQFPEPPSQVEDLDALLKTAMGSRLDVDAARAQSQALAARYGLQRRTRLIGSIEVGAERERDFDGSLNAGPTASIELPLFDWGGGRKARAQAELDRSEAQLDGLVLDVGNDVKRAQARMSAAQQRALAYRDELIPQREAIVASLQKEVNYMLAGVFELLVAKQDEYDAYAGYVEATKDYWTARAELARAIGRALPREVADTEHAGEN
ncbi:TolC family protein [Hydrocarboniphaga sp.]|uniref:TolC family protein n=1 Tax=Hydrocarboniphaga sp. TaxID=2033016 RepID=UPI003D11FACB